MFFKTFNLLFGLKCKKFDVDNINYIDKNYIDLIIIILHFYIDKKRKINRCITNKCVTITNVSC